VRIATEALPEDPDLLKATLLADQAESERLREIIKELQRHRFGRRAKSLPEEQLQLALQDVSRSRRPVRPRARRKLRSTGRSVPRGGGRIAAPYRPICLGPARGRIKTGQLFTNARDDRAWAARTHRS